jgi:hypothetical protein
VWTLANNNKGSKFGEWVNYEHINIITCHNTIQRITTSKRLFRNWTSHWESIKLKAQPTKRTKRTTRCAISDPGTSFNDEEKSIFTKKLPTRAEINVREGCTNLLEPVATVQWQWQCSPNWGLGWSGHKTSHNQKLVLHRENFFWIYT